MPVVFRFDGFRVIIYPNDHRPAHVHVQGAGVEAVFILDCPEGPPRLRESFGLKRFDVGYVIKALTAELAMLCAEWSSVHERG